MVQAWDLRDQPESMPIKKNTKFTPKSHEKAVFVNEVEGEPPKIDNETLIMNGNRNPSEMNNKNRKINKKSYFSQSLAGESSSKVYEDIELLLSGNQETKVDKNR